MTLDQITGIPTDANVILVNQHEYRRLELAAHNWKTMAALLLSKDEALLRLIEESPPFSTEADLSRLMERVRAEAYSNSPTFARLFKASE